MKEEIRKLEDEIAVLMTARNQRGDKVYEVDTRYRRHVQEKLQKVGEMKVAEAERVRIAQGDPVADAAYAAYLGRQAAARSMGTGQLNPLEAARTNAAIESSYKASSTAPSAAAPAAPVAQPVGRGGAIFSKAG